MILLRKGFLIIPGRLKEEIGKLRFIDSLFEEIFLFISKIFINIV